MGGHDDDRLTELQRSEMLTASPAIALAGVLGVSAPDLEGGEPLPLLWHWLYTVERPAQTDLGEDGHAVRGVIPAPPGPGRRRMWAGGRVETLRRLRSGDELTRSTQLIDEVVKDGRSGRLTFATVQHELIQHGQVAVRERQDIVYRDASSTRDPDQPSTFFQQLAPDEWEISIDPVLLFRFSALTYNAHRIHYDRAYATTVEGYAGLVTHGPLQALAMAEAARRQGIDASVGWKMDYRLVAPLLDHQGLVVACTTDVRAGAVMRVRDHSGRTTATASLARL